MFPLWENGDFSRHLQTLLPLSAAGASLLCLPFQLCCLAIFPRHHHAHSPVQNTFAAEDVGSEEPCPVNTRQTESTITVSRWRANFVIIVLEEMMVLAALAVHLAALTSRGRNHGGSTGATASIVVWVYIAFLASFQLLLSIAGRPSALRLRLRWHLAFNYGFQCCFQAVLLRSATAHQRLDLRVTALTLNSVLLIIALSFRRAMEIEGDGDTATDRESTAGIFTRWTFSWVDPIVWKGYGKVYEVSDVRELASADEAASVYSQFCSVEKSTALAYRLLGHQMPALLRQAGWAALSGLLTFAPTLLLQGILEYVENNQSTSRRTALLYVCLLFFCGCASAIADGQALWNGKRIDSHLHSISSGLIFTESLQRRREDANQPHVSTGAILNLMAVDAFKVGQVGTYLYSLCVTIPVQFPLAVFLLYRTLGYSSIFGVGTTMVLFLAHLYFSKQLAPMQRCIRSATDARMQLTNETLVNIGFIQSNAYENHFIGLIGEKRATELYHIRRRYLLSALVAAIWSVWPVVVAIVSFSVYTIVEQERLTPSVAFTALSLFQLLRIPLDELADATPHVQESKISAERIDRYLSGLSGPGAEDYVADKEDGDGQPIIGFEQGTFRYKAAADAFKLHDLNLHFKVGGLNVVVGPNGSGKTSLLMALLGQMSRLKGEAYLPRRSRGENRDTGSVAYCAKEAWLVDGNVKKNIVMAEQDDAKRYEAVIEACLLRSVEGHKLSGGEKQRVSLARALYSQAHCVLLDDVLSALDPDTAEKVFERALKGPLMRGRTCILVTHNVRLCLPHADFAVRMENGRVVAEGSADEIIDLSTRESPESHPAGTVAPIIPSSRRREASDENMVSRAVGGVNGSAGTRQNFVGNTPREANTEGSVSSRGISMYLRAMGPWYYWIAVTIAFAALQLSSISTHVWVRAWANAYADQNSSCEEIHSRMSVRAATSHGLRPCTENATILARVQQEEPRFFQGVTQTRLATLEHSVEHGYFLGVYVAIGIAFMLTSFLREYVPLLGSLSASRRIHERLIRGVTNADSDFFDRTPIARVLDCFAKDMEVIDHEVARTAVSVAHCLASALAIVVMISIFIPWFLAAGFFIALLYGAIGWLYVKPARELKRLESMQRSRLCEQFSEILAGRITIQAYGWEDLFRDAHHKEIDIYHRLAMGVKATNRWLAFRVGMLGAIVSLLTGAFVVFFAGVGAGVAGLVLTYATSFSGIVLRLVRRYSENEQNMNSVERIEEYLNVDPQPDGGIDTPAPSKGSTWGPVSVSFEAYTARYSSSKGPVLKNINVQVLPGEKLGIVGQTGAGKSTLAAALIRALHVEEGSIRIDGVDINSVSKEALSKNVAIVPQDPVLFSGTIRSNLDPTGEHTDEKIIEVLREVDLIPSAGTHSTSQPIETPNPELERSTAWLNSLVSESGSNLPRGTQQCLSLARAILRSPSVLVMDESTASMDPETEAKIQETIRKVCITTITITHRINTVVEYDRVLVLDRGEVVEFGHPYHMIMEEGSRFRATCDRSGLEDLENAARKAHGARACACSASARADGIEDILARAAHTGDIAKTGAHGSA